ncbi:DUF2905 domain-containing protein [Thioalkalivibrio sp.]|uniref:DUF2905 domain-containing protein n=1 Tax=Thioalkalivibrio sp. TaxID=2093813 RepID=UPI0012D6F4B2|nr:DUF2905 domain-containing protein [Thioalkalivibrio sp.]TVP81224.1 MAG: DUF2905 domain-containing protein [Thioalkalivibrio sp.]
MNVSPGVVLVFIGLALVGAGLLYMAGLLDWFGRLPGDIRIEGESTRVFIPITSMVIVSIVLSLVFHILRRFLG